MTAEEHIWAAMADLHRDMPEQEGEPLRDKLTQVLFSIRRWELDQRAKRRPMGINASVSLPRLAVVDHYRDRLAGIHVVDGDGDTAA